MRKITFLVLLAFVFCTGANVSAQQANIYAYGLKAEVTDLSVKFSYILNADATSATIKVSNGDEFALSGSELTKGARTVTKTLSGAPGTYTWSVTAAAANKSAATMVSDDYQVQFCVYNPWGLAVDNSFESEFFGNIYVANGRTGISQETGRPVRPMVDGIYGLDPLFNPLFDDSEVIKQGIPGIVGGTGGAIGWRALSGWDESPGRIFVCADGKILINSGTGLAPGPVMMDPADMYKDFVPVLSATPENGFWSSFIVGDALYAFDRLCDILKYDISGGFPATSESEFFYDDFENGQYIDKLGTTRFPTIMPVKGGVWVAATVDAPTDVPAGKPCVLFIDNTGKIVYKLDKDNGGNVNGSYGCLAISKDESLLAIQDFNGVNAVVYSITTNGDGIPTQLTQEYTVPLERTCYSIAFDVANNLYAAAAGPEWIRVWATPKATNETTTPAPSAQAIKIDGTGIGTIEAPALPKAYYNILGVKLANEPESGIYIIQYDNGTTKKVMKK